MLVGLISRTRLGGAGSASRPPFMAMYFRLENGVIRSVRFRAFGCGLVIAAGSGVTEIIVNRGIEDCVELGEEDIARVLGGLPPEKRWCAAFALTAMRPRSGCDSR